MKAAGLAAAAAVGLCAALAVGLPVPAQAGQDCDAQPIGRGELVRALALGEATAQALDASGAQVVVLARAGQDLSRFGLAWSHLGFAYRASDDAADGWRIVHKLNHCGQPDAALYRQGLAQFFLERPVRWEAAVVVPAAALQARLLPLLRDDARAAALHEPRYNLVAYPWSVRYQQSNQWAIETLAMAAAADAEPAVRDRTRAQAWLRAQGYVPTVLHLGALERLGARVTRANLAFDDHPNAERFADRIATVTVDSVFAWLQRRGLAGPPQLVREGAGSAVTAPGYSPPQAHPPA